MQREYLNSYGNLMRASDAYLVKILDTLTSAGPLENPLVIATADHGEMGMAHGGLRQKNFNVYEESIRVPLVYSNPRLFPRTRSSDALVSHVDFLPTLARLIGAPAAARDYWQGIRLRRIHVRRLAVRAGEGPVPGCAEPHREHPRAPLQARP